MTKQNIYKWNGYSNICINKVDWLPSYYRPTSGLHLSPLSGGRRYNCPLHCSVQCSNATPVEHSCGNFILSLDMLSNIDWFLKFAKASKRFYWPCGLSGLRTGPMLWPQCWVPAHADIHPTGKVRLTGLHWRLVQHQHWVTLNNINCPGPQSHTNFLSSLFFIL